MRQTLTPPPDAVAVASLLVAAIAPSLSNPRKRFDDAYIAELADSIKSHGLIQPITVRPLSLDSLFAFNKRAHPDDERPTYEIVVGECRWRAAKLAGLAEIPAFWRELDDKQVLEIQVVENLQRRDVHPIEEAEGYQALIARHGYNADQIAAKIGKSRSYIYGRLKLTALCQAAREAFFAGTLEGSTALLIARIPGEALQKKACKEVLNGYNGEPLSYRAAKQHIHSRYTLSLKQATFKPDDATLLPAAGACSACPKLSGNFHDLFNDIEAADVCTDPDCFEAKRQARRDRLIANAEKKKIPVLTDTEARDAWHSGDFVKLDNVCPVDAERRTYREILGDQTPAPSVLIEQPFGDKDLFEAVSEGAIQKALKKAGFTTKSDDTQDIKKAQRERQAAANRNQALAEQETKCRQDALAAALAALHDRELDTDGFTENLLYLLAEVWLREHTDYNELADLEDGIRAHLDAGYALPDEYDDDDELPRAVAILRAAPLSRVVAFMISDSIGNLECRINQWDLLDKPRNTSAPHTLVPLTKLLGIPFESATHPASTPSQAAHAEEIIAPPAAPAEEPKPAKKPAAKKAKAKADPALATPANEAAAPPKTSATQPWPFPTGADA